MSDPMPAGRGTRLVQRGILAVLLFGAVGTLAELALIGHNEDWWQIAPLALLGAVIAVSAAQLARPSDRTRAALLVVMWLSIGSGALGNWLHYKGNAEFEREMYPDRAGVELFTESMTGATPVLAPGTMSVIGLLEVVAVWRPRGMR
ncbi:MAG: hypothetical protein GKS06_14240 [Acidobacteria bacterium]|nr:hypothetical protein [Acidobacteriota bacterium]